MTICTFDIGWKHTCGQAHMKAKHTSIQKLHVFADPMYIFGQNRFLAWTDIFFVFGNKFSQKGYFGWKIGKNEHHHWILHIGISLGTKFSLNWQFWFFYQTYSKGYFWSKTDNSQFCVRPWLLLTILNISTR